MNNVKFKFTGLSRADSTQIVASDGEYTVNFIQRLFSDLVK